MDERFLLLQTRKSDDLMRGQEIDCFARALSCRLEQIDVCDLLSAAPTRQHLDSVDVVLLGGSGDFSVAEGGPWLADAMVAMRELFELGKPTFASCWGFQAMAKALGGEVVTDKRRAELGTIQVFLTAAGRADPVFGPTGGSFLAPMGHQDCVVRLPEQAVLLASSAKVENQAYCFPGKPIYGTQFHPELNRTALIERIRAYPQYAREISGLPIDDFVLSLQETTATDQLLGRFMQWWRSNR